MTPDLIGSDEVAHKLGWSRSKVKREAKEGRLPFALKMPGDTGAYLFDAAVIAELAAERVAS